MANIHTAINGIMSDVGAIGKESENQQQGFMYRGVDAVMNALQPALVKYKVFVVPEVLEQTREERTTAKGGLLLYSILKVKFTFYADDGSSVSATVIGEGMDSGDKASNKAMSVAFKYACFQVFCIPTEEMVDPDSEAHNVKPKSDKPEPPAQTDEKENVVNALDAFIKAETKKGHSKLDILNAFILGSDYEPKRDKLIDHVISKYVVKDFEDITFEQLLQTLYSVNAKIGKNR